MSYLYVPECREWPAKEFRASLVAAVSFVHVTASAVCICFPFARQNDAAREG
jgi:hypothetical protein